MAARTVAEISASEWAREMNHASCCDGGSRIPDARIERKNRANSEPSDCIASA